MRVCWNRQTGTFEGRVSMTYEFKSRHSHQPKDLTNGLIKRFVRFYFYLESLMFFAVFFMVLLSQASQP